MPPSESLKYLVQDLIDGRLSRDDAARVEQLIRGDPELAHTARFYRWLNSQLPKLFEPGKQALPPRLQQLLDEFASEDATAAEDADGTVPAGAPTLSTKT
jgi:anti-sigma factor RsiW